MQRQYAKDGLAAVSVSLDDPKDEEARARVLKFLRSKNADFTDLLLNETSEQWSDRLKIDSPPAVFVFGRDGRLAGKFEGKKVDYATQIEPLVVELLKK